MRVKCFWASLVIANFILCFSSIGRAVEDETLVFYISCDKASGNTVEDESGNGNTGTLEGDAKITKDGKFGSALSVSGKGYVDCGNGEVLNQEFPGLTIEAWIYPKALGGIQAPVVKWAWAVAGDHFGFFLSENYALAAVADGKVSEGGFTGKEAINENEWTHVAVTWNSKDNTYEIYINGELDGKEKQAGAGINTNSQETLKIGAQITGTERYFNGLIDEVAIYGRVLTENEIKKDMKGISTSVQPSGKVSATWANIKTEYLNN